MTQVGTTQVGMQDSESTQSVSVRDTLYSQTYEKSTNDKSVYMNNFPGVDRTHNCELFGFL